MYHHWKRILHPSDLTPGSHAAFVYAVKLARRPRSEVVLLHVLTPLEPYEAEALAAPGLYARYQAERREDAERRLTVLVGQARRLGVRARGLIVDGTPQREILGTARSTRADLIVMGLRPRNGLRRALFGSVAAHVVRTAGCPVLVVRGRERGQAGPAATAVSRRAG
jgi:nucleotide-binding universal stress UspA family protein